MRKLYAEVQAPQLNEELSLKDRKITSLNAKIKASKQDLREKELHLKKMMKSRKRSVTKVRQLEEENNRLRDSIIALEKKVEKKERAGD